MPVHQSSVVGSSYDMYVTAVTQTGTAAPPQLSTMSHLVLSSLSCPSLTSLCTGSTILPLICHQQHYNPTPSGKHLQ